MKISQRQEKISDLLLKLSEFIPSLQGISLAMRTIWFSPNSLEKYENTLVYIKKGLLKRLSEKSITRQQKNKILKMLTILK